MSRSHLARDVYGKADRPDFEDQPPFEGRRPKATRCVTRKATRFCSCGAPLKGKAKNCVHCERRKANRPSPDSVQEQKMWKEMPSLFTGM